MADELNTLVLNLDSGGDVVIRCAPTSRPAMSSGSSELASEGLLRRRRLPPRDPRLHGAGRRSDRHRHRRLQASRPQGRVQPSRTSAAPARWRAPTIPNSANSQFFICFDDARFLDKQYTVWGKVVEGMEHVDALPKGEPPREPGKIVKASLSA
jgi:peptidylprolyl isomerase